MDRWIVWNSQFPKAHVLQVLIKPLTLSWVKYKIISSRVIISWICYHERRQRKWWFQWHQWGNKRRQWRTRQKRTSCHQTGCEYVRRVYRNGGRGVGGWKDPDTRYQCTKFYHALCFLRNITVNYKRNMWKSYIVLSMYWLIDCVF